MAGESWRVAFSGGRDLLPAAPPMDSECQESEIGKFYEGRSIFITGATGFMGKVSDGKVKSGSVHMRETRERRERGREKWVNESENTVQKPVRKREDVFETLFSFQFHCL